MAIKDELARRYLGRRVVDESGAEGRITEIDMGLLKVEYFLGFVITWRGVHEFQGEHRKFTIIKPRMRMTSDKRWVCLYEGDFSVFAFDTMEQAYIHCCMTNGEPVCKELADKHLKRVSV